MNLSFVNTGRLSILTPYPVGSRRDSHSRATGLSAKYLKLPVWIAALSPNATERCDMALPHSPQKIRVTSKTYSTRAGCRRKARVHTCVSAGSNDAILLDRSLDGGVRLGSEDVGAERGSRSLLTVPAVAKDLVLKAVAVLDNDGRLGAKALSLDGVIGHVQVRLGLQS